MNSPLVYFANQESDVSAGFWVTRAAESQELVTLSVWGYSEIKEFVFDLFIVQSGTKYRMKASLFFWTGKGLKFLNLRKWCLTSFITNKTGCFTY